MNNNNSALYIGLMSGTSADGIDLALVNLANKKITLVASYFQAYSPEQYQAITSLYLSANNEIDRAFTLDISLAKTFAKAVEQFLIQEKLSADDIAAIGNHGQTIRHHPNQEQAFTLQIGCNQTLASLTGIRVIGDFRKKDMVYGGQGAPLVPAFHRALFPEQNKDTFIVNIGGIANITFLPAKPNANIVGFDTGPGNALMDAWFQQYNNGQFDKNGAWANIGICDSTLLKTLLSDSYFQQLAPKSTGREYFHLPWLLEKLNSSITSVDVQATLLQLTAQSITIEIKKLSELGNVYLCGGGALNHALVDAINDLLPLHSVQETEQLNIDGDALEAMAFAWFAYAYDHKIFGNIPSATGASKALVLGVEYFS